ncbi:helix-turn-helix domain-containing protein [Teichococcus coralli]|nr:helix-turn-helix domain-containing protein [Pseudoroseomonas coralli]
MLRLVILRLLIAGREAAAGALVERAGLSRQARSQRLARPWEDGLVATRRTGTTIRSGIADPRVARIIATLHDAFCLPAP